MLLALINNLVADERAPTPLRRMPSTRELSRLARGTRARRRVL
jgi:hypothetical protein